MDSLYHTPGFHTVLDKKPVLFFDGHLEHQYKMEEKPNGWSDSHTAYRQNIHS